LYVLKHWIPAFAGMTIRNKPQNASLDALVKPEHEEGRGVRMLSGMTDLTTANKFAVIPAQAGIQCIERVNVKKSTLKRVL
jgi:hypothetical protein